VGVHEKGDVPRDKNGVPLYFVECPRGFRQPASIPEQVTIWGSMNRLLFFDLDRFLLCKFSIDGT